MKPISFVCQGVLPATPQEIVRQILNVDRWNEFQGYGVLPGIRRAEFEVRTPELVGTRIRVNNTDGSRHVEEIVEWQPERRLVMRLGEFSPPLARLATSFDETWEFEPADGGTRVGRTFRLHARSAVWWPVLWVISRLLRRAVARHLAQMAAATA